MVLSCVDALCRHNVLLDAALLVRSACTRARVPECEQLGQSLDALQRDDVANCRGVARLLLDERTRPRFRRYRGSPMIGLEGPD